MKFNKKGKLPSYLDGNLPFSSFSTQKFYYWSGRQQVLENVFTFSSCGVNSRKLIQCPAGTARAEAPELSVAREKAEAVPAESDCLKRKSTALNENE